MNPVIAAVLFTLFLWWSGTGVILYLDGLPRRTFALTLCIAGFIAMGALIALTVASRDASASSAYLAFTCAMVIWGWQEVAFLTGFVTGPRHSVCPSRASDWEKFKFASETILYHELALVGCLILINIATWQQPNQIGAQTFLILWTMRLSAKLNLFFGVRNQYANFLPEHLVHLASYFGKRSINLLFPVSVTAAGLMGFFLWESSLYSEAGAYEQSGHALLAMLLSLAVLEHWFLVLPLPVESMWRWALGSRSTPPDLLK